MSLLATLVLAAASAHVEAEGAPPAAATATLAASQESGPPSQATGTHPRLVSADSTRCQTCHQAVVGGKATVHEPVADDCTYCHTVETGDSGTQIALADEQPALCLGCHSDLEAAAAGELTVPHMPVVDSCTNCHDPHTSDARNLLTAEPRALCAECHSVDDLKPQHSGQLSGSVECLTCHLPHGSAATHMLAGENLHAPFADNSCEACHRPPFAGRIRLVGRGEAVCTSCHGDLAEAPGGGSQHPAILASGSGRGCVSCHDPHMSANAQLLVRQGPALCAECHSEVVKGAADEETGHLAAADDCLTCHQPHTSSESRLLTSPTAELCGMCHDVSDADLSRAHLGADLSELECLSCHSPHGAGNAHLLARHAHAPVLDGCTACHESSASKLVEDGEPALCLACHVDVEEKVRAAKVPHLAMEVASCVDCHSPHASAQERLVNLPAGGECLTCHADQEAQEGESAHGVIGLVGCQACHDPHGGDAPKLLRASGDALCLGCHGVDRPRPEAAAATATLMGRFEVPAEAVRKLPVLRLTADGKRGHPTPGHPIVGSVSADPHEAPADVTFTGSLSCLACHDPHKGKHQLLKWDSRSEACLACHRK